MVISKKTSKIQKFFVFEVAFFTKNCSIFVSSASIILSQVITESSTILTKYLPFLQLHVTGFQM